MTQSPKATPKSHFSARREVPPDRRPLPVQSRGKVMLSRTARLVTGLRSLTMAVPLIVCLFASGVLHAQDAAPRLRSDSDVATAGYFRLSWETDAARAELQEASSPEFHNPVTAYLGPDRATVFSGKPNGTWYYRVRALGNPHAGPWSEPVAVVVAHHSLSRALMFLALGIFIFIAMVLLVVRGPGKVE